MVPNGLMSFHAYYGAIGPHPAEPPGRLHSSWSTGLKHAFPQKFTWAHLGSRLFTNPCRSSSGVTMSTSSTSDGGEQQFEMHATTRRSGTIINGSCTVGSSGLASRATQTLPQLGGALQDHRSVPARMRPPCHRRWGAAAQPMEYRASA